MATGGNWLSDYPLDGEETFISRLFDPTTAADTIESFNQRISKQLVQ